MLRERGFIEMWMVQAVAFAALVAALAFSVHHGAAVQSEYDMYRGGVEAVGREQNRITAAKTLQDIKDKRNADEKNARDTANFKRTIAGLRDAKPSASFVPPAPPDSRRPDLICFDRAEYQRADGAFTEGARGLSDEGTKNTVDLNTGKEWVQGGK